MCFRRSLPLRLSVRTHTRPNNPSQRSFDSQFNLINHVSHKKQQQQKLLIEAPCQDKSAQRMLCLLKFKASKQKAGPILALPPFSNRQIWNHPEAYTSPIV
jgi:hypothetical protein